MENTNKSKEEGEMNEFFKNLTLLNIKKPVRDEIMRMLRAYTAHIKSDLADAFKCHKITEQAMEKIPHERGYDHAVIHNEVLDWAIRTVTKSTKEELLELDKTNGF